MERVFVAQVPALQLGGGEEKPERGIPEFIRQLGTQLERQGFDRLVECQHLRPDIAGHHRGGEGAAVTDIAAGHIEEHRKSSVTFILRKNWLEIGPDAEVAIEPQSPADAESIVAGAEGAQMVLFPVVLLEASVIHEVEAEADGAQPVEGVGIGDRPHSAATEHRHDTQHTRAAHRGAQQRGIVDTDGEVVAIKCKIVQPQSGRAPHGAQVQARQGVHACYLSLTGV